MVKSHSLNFAQIPPLRGGGEYSCLGVILLLEIKNACGYIQRQRVEWNVRWEWGKNDSNHIYALGASADPGQSTQKTQHNPRELI